MRNPLILLLLLQALQSVWTGSILHSPRGATSHQSFVRLPMQHLILPLLPERRLTMPTARIINANTKRAKVEMDHLHLSPPPLTLQAAHTPAHLTFAAHPVVHQSLPQIKPVRSISYASLQPGPRNLRPQQ